MVTGASIRALRKQVGRSQAEVAVAAGLPASVLSAYERGRRQPSLEMASRIVEALGFRIEFVRGLDPRRQAILLEDVLVLAEQLPYRPRPLIRPDWEATKTFHRSQSSVVRSPQ